MDRDAIGQIFFDETYTVPSHSASLRAPIASKNGALGGCSPTSQSRLRAVRTPIKATGRIAAAFVAR